MQRTRVNKWLPNNEQVIILPGERAEQIARDHNLYRCQTIAHFGLQNMLPSTGRGAIKYLFEIIDEPYRNYTPDNTPELQTVSRYKNNNEAGQVMFLKYVAEVGPILNDTIASTGRRLPFAQSQRYTTYEKVMRARVTSKLYAFERARVSIYRTLQPVTKRRHFFITADVSYHQSLFSRQHSRNQNCLQSSPKQCYKTSVLIHNYRGFGTAMVAQPQTKRLLDLVRKTGVLRPQELDRHGIPRVYLKRLVDAGELQRIGRGLYAVSNADLTEKHSLVQASKRVPSGVICLLSALRFHELTTQNPFEVWIAIDQKAWRPAVNHPPLRIVHLSGNAFSSGIEDHLIEGINVRVYSAAKTVADCFKFRNKIGTDVALEALRDYRRKYRSGMDELWRYAKLCRVTRVMQPYLEALG